MSSPGLPVAQRDGAVSSAVSAAPLGRDQLGHRATNEEARIFFAVPSVGFGLREGYETSARERATVFEQASASNSPSSKPLRVLVAPARVARALDFELLQQWEGTVAEVRSDEFVATLRDLEDPGDPARLEAVFGREEVAGGDEHLLMEGAVFVWTIGRKKSPWGQIENVDFIRFLRLPAWTRRELQQAQQRGDRLKEIFGPDAS